MYRRVERTQYQFMVLYQVLILILAVAAAALIGWALVLVARGDPGWDAVVTGGAGVVSGALMAFPIKQRADARKEHAAAVKAIEEGHCDTDLTRAV